MKKRACIVITIIDDTDEATVNTSAEVIKQKHFKHTDLSNIVQTLIEGLTMLYTEQRWEEEHGSTKQKDDTDPQSAVDYKH